MSFSHLPPWRGKMLTILSLRGSWFRVSHSKFINMYFLISFDFRTLTFWAISFCFLQLSGVLELHVLADERCLCSSFPKLVWNQLCWEYLHHRNCQMLQIDFLLLLLLLSQFASTQCLTQTTYLHHHNCMTLCKLLCSHFNRRKTIPSLLLLDHRGNLKTQTNLYAHVL